MAHNEPQRKETPPRPSPNSPSLLFEILNISVEAANLSDWRIESNQIETFLPELECSNRQRAEKTTINPFFSSHNTD